MREGHRAVDQLAAGPHAFQEALWYRHAEGALDGHGDLRQIQRVGRQILDERDLARELVHVDPE